MQKLFADLQGNYGARFIDMWRSGQTLADGTDAGIKNAMNQWREKLAGFADQPGRIRKALAALPTHPPTLPEFIALCRQQQPDAATTNHSAPALPKKDAFQTARHINALAQQFAARPAPASNAGIIRRGSTLDWACAPPAAALRGPWARAIIDCARRGDARFVPILARHVSDGTISGSAAQSALEQSDTASEDKACDTG